jgi:murein DD-endopeptidase MepM/ murein hydrolase activator NlpD
MKQRESLFVDVLIGAILAASCLLIWNKYIKEEPVGSELIAETGVDKKKKVYKFGFDLSSVAIEELEIKPNQFLGDILSDYQIPFTKISLLEQLSKDVFSVRRIKAGKKLTFVKEDECGSPFCMIYEPDPFSYVKYGLDDSLTVDIHDKSFTIEIDSASGIVESSLWNSMIENGQNAVMIDKMEDAFASAVDFYYTQKGDKYKMIYERKTIEGGYETVGDILAAYYENEGGRHYSIYYENDKYAGFYDIDGRPTKGEFLRAPVKYSRISSKFNRNRFHPIKKRRIPHLGTDYAAAYGTPIHSVSDGVVIKASYTRNNGKYVKIKHDKTYTTQYLHMSRFAKGIKKGNRVKQGQTIGFVGSTGLATGPHVCFRFWKNGKQINHLRENFPPADPMGDDELPEFYSYRDSIINVLNGDEIFPALSESDNP